MCHRPVLIVREGPRRSKMGLTRLAPYTWKSVRGQNVSKTSTLNLGGSKEVKTGLTRLAPESCKSVRGLNVSQTSYFGWGVSTK